jgi:hypothetical protein
VNTVTGRVDDTIPVKVAPVTIANGSGTAVWEVRGANSQSTDDYVFFVYFSATGNPANNSPTAGQQGTIGGSFAPVYDPEVGGVASSSLPIPRFVDTGSAANLIVINLCRTNILFPFVTNKAGFDTGLTISNTSKDSFGTGAQTGTCTLFFFGDTPPPGGQIATVPITDGATYSTVASTAFPGFQGYVFAQCNFQFGHGFAFISDVGARNLAMGYLGLVLPDPPRNITALSLAGGSGELLGH